MTMDIRLARIDSRLLHGQVATVWTKSVTPNRILVVSDTVAKDNLRKTLITQAAPPGVKANVITLDKMIQINKDPRFDVFKAIILTETPADMLKLAEGGVDFSQVGIDVGSIAFSDGMTMLNDSIAVDNDMAAQLRKLHDDFNLDVYAQKVPADKKQDMMELLSKKGF
ncbi:PTS system mannose/fructose/N-acetylgalactosamine-transporter subunit IIB [Lentilactobacillus senioris]|uniref:Protein-N(Pi)-phosphohistidine--sugar phosphotransferase n=1 Tax=Lentilactobacillus senioris DSM 24302 = JCM 17472 TaxID=1423802 RepID=A0A0R2CNU8_9LACO|nr:PTS sugar transporter subunit IIB [Lentilactobacillus senioris]KRM93393.1 protein-N(pi)-phosphohistidine--sugar phosphotransferase [Lentilactobacillus senioris DSM 24302 = JCM 17472]MCY9807125.1 PTS sugar transporter subunit IIB [Lentilactobacillus senioris]